MEGHPRYEAPGAAPAPGRVDSSDATRKRVFLLLDRKRRSLTAQLRPSWRLRGRYEDLSLVMILARLERDWLSQPRPHLSGGDHPKGHGDQPGHWLADWAKPWGAAPQMKLDLDIARADGALKRLGRWLSRRTVAKAEGRARERLEAITTEVEERDPQARAAAVDAAQGAASKTRGFERPSHTRVAAIAGLFLLAAGAGAFLLASHTGTGPGDSVSRGAVEGVRQHSGALDVHTQRGSGQRSRGAGQSASPPGHPGTQGSARARSRGAGQSAPVASEIAPPAPQPAPVPQPAAALQTAPAPAPPSSPPSSTSSQAKSAGGGGGCPPEFGYEC
jgi:hypothetical protein